MDSKTRTENKVRFIKRFIDFCYADFENESPANKNMLFSQIGCLSFGIGFNHEMEFGSPPDDQWELLKECQKDLKKFIEWCFDNLNHSIKLFFQIRSVFTSGFEGVKDTYNFEILSSAGYVDGNLKLKVKKNSLEVLVN